jgi:hypothetical protein
MPLTACPDCGREVSTAAPVCIHCGRPLAEPAPAVASAAPAPAKPMAGIVTALVLGVLHIVWALGRDPASTERAREVNSLIDGVHTLGNAALIIFALLSLSGHRAANGMVRALSVMMMLAICGCMLLTWDVAEDMLAQGNTPPGAGGFVGAVVVVSTAIQVAPWLLYLYLFRKSRHP